MDFSKVFELPVKEFAPLPRGLLGPGASEMVGTEAASLGLRHVLLVTSGLGGTGIVDDVKDHLEKAGVAVTVYDKVESNPKDYNSMESYELFTQEQCDGFVSVGGGSSHDTVKGARAVVSHDGRNVNEFQGLNTTETRQNPPQIAVNTTVGTGAETTMNVVITDTTSPDAPHKYVITDRNLFPHLAINDPVYLMEQPPEYIAFTGCDTLSHGAECYTSRVWMPTSQPVALHGIKLVAENLREAASNPHNFEAMSNMMWAQYIVAQAFSSGYLGVCHSLSHAVCAYYDTHHGLNNGIGMSRVFEYNQGANTKRFAEMAEAMGEDTKGLSTTEAADRAIDATIRLVHDLGIPDNFQSVDPNYPKSRMGVVGKNWYEQHHRTEIDDTYLEEMADHMMRDLCNAGNPREVTLEGCREMLRDSIFDPMVRKTDGARVRGMAMAGDRSTVSAGEVQDTYTARQQQQQRQQEAAQE